MARATAAEKAFKAAQVAIAEAAKTGANVLRLSGDSYAHLDSLPEEIAALTQLRGLRLQGTKVRELLPVRSLVSLEWLDIEGTQVKDLSSIQNLRKLKYLDVAATEVDRHSLLNLHGLAGIIPPDDQLRIPFSSASFTQPSSEAPVTKEIRRGWWTIGTASEKRNLAKEFRGVRLIGSLATREDARIAEIALIKDDRDRTIALFEELGLEWRDVAPEPSPQSDSGLRYAPNKTGVVTYDPAAAVAVQDAQQRQLHVLLREDASEVILLFGGGHNQPFAAVTRKLERYGVGLGDDLDRLNPALVWKTGNDLRNILQADKGRRPGDMTNQLAFDVDQRAGLEGMISAHNALVALHPALSKLDEVSVDPALRHIAERDRALMQAAIDAFAQQTRLIMAEVVGDLRDLHDEAMGETRAAMRAGRIEVESLENLIKAIVTEAILEARGESTLSKLAGDVRSAAVGTVAVGAATMAGPALAATYPQLVAALQPHIAALMAAWHGKDYPVAQAVEWVMRRFRG